MDESPALGHPTAHRVVRFSDEPARPVRRLLAGFAEEQAVNERRLQVAETVLEREDQLREWLHADPEHPRRLLTDPGAVLREVFPDLEPVELPLAGRHLMDRLLTSAGSLDAGIVVHSPPEVLAVALLRDVAERAGTQPDGYAALVADVAGTVAAVAGARYGPDVVARVVEGVRRAFVGPAQPWGLAVPVAVPSALLTLLAAEPGTRAHLADGVVGEVGAHGVG